MAKPLDHTSTIPLAVKTVLNERYFLDMLEKDLQNLFVSLELSEIPTVKISRMKALMPNGDITCLLGSTFSELDVLKVLIAKLNALPYISKSHFDNFKHLIMYLNKPIVFQSVINQVSQYNSEYGLIDSNQFRSCLIILHGSFGKTLSRLTLLTEHLLCFLNFNRRKVSISGFESSSAFMSVISPISCSEECSQGIKILSEQIFSESTQCDYRKHLKCQNDNILIDGESFAFRYPHKIRLIKISDAESKIVKDSAHSLHFARYHSTECDAIIHICAYKDFDKLVQSSCLSEVLGLTNTPEFFINCQGVSFNSSDGMGVEAYLAHSRREISKAILDCNSSDLTLNEMLDALLDTSVKFTFLAGRTNSTLRLNVTDNENFRKDDGIFVQYNFARLSKLLETFELKVKDGHYHKLPELNQIDFNLLQEKEEWDLLKFIMFYPSVIEEVYNSIFSRNGFLSNKIFLMLKNLSHLFSKYYRRVHVLTGPELQLQKVMFARIWLLKGIHQIMLNSFKMINVKGLCSM